MAPTIKDVAKAANTSKSTVSRFLNGQPVKKKTEEALKKAIQELNYHPNMNARRLVMNRTKVIGIVVDDISNIFYSEILKGIREVANLNGFECVYHSWNLNKTEKDYLDLLYEEQVDGLILLSFAKRKREDVEFIRDNPSAVVLIGDHAGVEEVLSVDVDNLNGIVEMVNYLYRIGHRKIAYIGGPESAGATQQRTEGFKHALNDLGLPFQPDLVVESDWSNQGGNAAMKKLLEVGGFTAVVASNDESALGALRAAHEQGYSVPKDFSIVGFDDIEIASWVFPSLTTVRQPFREMGNRAAKELFGQIEEAASIPTRILLEPKLIIRHSCLRI